MYMRQLDYSRSWKKVAPARAAYTAKSALPDLVITDIVHDGPYLKVKYRNASPGATGGFTLGLVGITPGSEVDVVATIDPEDRVRESDESNNRFSMRVHVKS